MIQATDTAAPPMKLSAAMREGAKLRPQAIGAYFYDGKSCALGAAAEALDAAMYERGSDRAVEKLLGNQFGLWGRKTTKLPCPAGCHTEYIVGHMITHLNDDHDWEREAIADWLEGLGL